MGLVNKIYSTYLGLTDYGTVWDLQRKLYELRLSEQIPDTLLLNEHQHVYTFGKGSDENHLLAGEEILKMRGADVYRIDRGGDVTYHGPGQLVGYPIFNLENYYHDVHRYLRDLEEVIIRTLAEYGIIGRREKEFTGVWVGNDKVAALGIKISHWITMHGFALNVNTDLSYFDSIIPCGIFHKGVTSLGQLLDKECNLEEVAHKITNNIGIVFGAEVIESPIDSIMKPIDKIYLEKDEWLQAARIQ